MITLLEGYSFAWRHDVAHDDDDGHKILLWTAKLLPTQNALPLMSLSEVSRCRRVRVRERERVNRSTSYVPSTEMGAYDVCPR